MVEALRSLGAEVTPMPLGKVLFDALARGVLDGADLSVDSIWARELFRSLRYLSLTGHVYSPGIIAVSRAAHDRLSDPDRQALVEAARLAAQNDRKHDDDLEAAGIANLLSAGMRINADVDKAAFRAALAPAYTKWREQFGDLIDRIQAYQ
jgi:TRAP-type C4-dicarboxylate transport system substrate-binding protein